MKLLKRLFFILMLLPIFVQAETSVDQLVKSYILIEAETGQVLLNQDADVELPPASITKLMTAYVTFQALEEGKISLDDRVTISEEAYRQEGSRMFIELNSQVSVDDLLQGLIVQSGNDAAVALAEYVGGSVNGFVQMMNDAAKNLGLSHTHYMNPNGLTIEGHYTTARDIAILSRALVQNFPNYYHYYSQKEFTWNNIKQSNRNQLLWRNNKVDGLKTGHTEAAGYCLVASEKRDQLRLISVVLGAEVESNRYKASQELLNIGFAQFSYVSPLKAGQVLTQAQVFKGKQNTIDVAAKDGVDLMMLKGTQLNAKLTLDTVIAPVEKGEVIGKIVITDGRKEYVTVPAVAAFAVDKANIVKRVWHGLKLWWKN